MPVSKRRLKRVKVQAAESVAVVEAMMALLASRGVTISLPSDIVPAVERLLSGVTPRAGRPIPIPGSRPAPPLPGPSAKNTTRIPAPDPLKEVGLSPEEMEAKYQEKLNRTMQTAQATGIRVGPDGERVIARPQAIGQLEDDQTEAETSFADEEEEEEDSASSSPGDDRVNRVTGMSRSAQAALIEKLTGKKPNPPTPGAPNPKALGGG